MVDEANKKHTCFISNQKKWNHVWIIELGMNVPTTVIITFSENGYEQNI